MSRTLRRVGGSIVVAIPPEMLEETGLREGSRVVLRSRPGRGIEVLPENDLDPEFVGWVYRTRQCRDEVYRELANMRFPR